MGTVGGTLTAIMAPSGSGSTVAGSNVPVSPTFTGVLDANKTSVTTSTVILTPTGRAAQIATTGLTFTSATYVGAGFTAGLPLNMSSGFIFGHYKLDVSGGLGTIAQNGIVLALRSGLGNWRRFLIGGSDNNAANYPHQRINNYFPFHVQPSASSPIADTGTFNPANVDLIEFHFYWISSSGVRIQIDECLFINNLELAGGSSGTPATLTALSNYFDFQGSGTLPCQLIIKQGEAQFYLYPVNLAIRAAYFDQAFALEFAKASIDSVRVSTASPGVSVEPPAASTLNLRNSSIRSDRSFFYNSSVDASATINLQNVFVNGPGAVVLDSDYVQSGGAFIGRNEVAMNGATLSNFSISNSTDVSAVLLSTAGGLQGSTVSGNTVGVRIAAAGDYTNNSPTLRNNTSRDVLISSGVTGGGTVAINTSSFIFPSTSTTPTVKIRVEDTTGTINLTVPAGITSANISSAGATVNVIGPSNAIIVTGFPTAANANGLAPQPVFGIYASDGITLLASFNTSDPEYNGDGSFTVLLTDYQASGTVRLVGDAWGWVRSPLVTVSDVTDPPSSVDFGILFEEITDEDGNAIAGLGNSTVMAGLTYDQPNTRFELDYVAAGYDPYSVLDKKEALTSTELGLAIFNTNIIRQIKFTFNKYGNEIQLPAPLVVSASATAAQSPALVRLTVSRLGDPAADVFVHGLASSVSGLTDRPEVRQLQTRFISATEGGGGGGATAAEIWSYSDRSLTDKAGFSLSTAGITAVVQGVWNALTNTLTVDGSIGKFVVDRLADVATLLARLTSTRAANLDNLDIAVSSRLATTSYTAPPTASAIATAVWNATTRALTDKAGFELSTAERTALATAIEAALINEGDGQMLIDAILDVINSSLDLPALELTAIAQAVRGELATELGFIDVAISSRAEPGDVAVTVDGGFGASDRTDLQAAKTAAEALADGRQSIDYTTSTFTQYNPDGTPRQVFDLLDADGTPATSAQNAVERLPQ